MTMEFAFNDENYELADIDPSMCSNRSSTVQRMSAVEPIDDEVE